MPRPHKSLLQIRSTGASPSDSDPGPIDEIKLKLELRQLHGSEALSTHKTRMVPAVFQSTRTGTKELLLSIMHARAERARFLPADLFADPAWDMLLDLYLADILSKRVSVSSLCSASNVPATTALRWIGALDRAGLIVRKSDPWDGRRSHISLSENGLERMDNYFLTVQPTGGA